MGYGGDFGDSPNDGNFCADGLVTADRQIQSNLLELKNVQRPIRARLKDGKVWLTNYWDFTNTAERLSIRYQLSENGIVMQEGKINGLQIAPKHTALLPLELPADNGNLWLLTLFYEQCHATDFVPATSILGFDQLNLFHRPRLPIMPPLGVEPPTKATFSVQEDTKHIRVQQQDHCYVFDKQKGILQQIFHQGESLLQQPLDFNIWRAPLDNDGLINAHWQAAGYDRAITRAYECHVTQYESAVEIKVKSALVTVSKARILTLDVIYRLDEIGTLHIKIHGEKAPHLPFLPRFGLRFCLDRAYQQAEYFGYGPTESYIDKHQSSLLGHYHTTVRQNHVPYLKPQENGSHYGCSYVKVWSENRQIFITATTPFSFNLSPYRQEELAMKKHHDDLVESNSTVLCIDYKMSGIGSNSCGPALKQAYRLNETLFDFDVKCHFLTHSI